MKEKNVQIEFKTKFAHYLGNEALDIFRFHYDPYTKDAVMRTRMDFRDKTWSYIRMLEKLFPLDFVDRYDILAISKSCARHYIKKYCKPCYTHFTFCKENADLIRLRDVDDITAGIDCRGKEFFTFHMINGKEEVWYPSNRA